MGSRKTWNFPKLQPFIWHAVYVWCLSPIDNQYLTTSLTVEGNIEKCEGEKSATCPLKSLCTAMEMLAFVGILLTLFGELAGKLFFINFFFVHWSMITEILFSITIYWCRNKVNFNWNVLKTTLAILVSQQWSVKLYIYIRCIYMDVVNDRWLFF